MRTQIQKSRANPYISTSGGLTQAKIYTVTLKTRIKYKITNILGPSQTGKLIAKEIAEYFSEENPFRCFLSSRDLAIKIGRTRRTVSRCLRQLEDQLLIISVPSFRQHKYGAIPQTSNSYALTPYAISLALNDEDFSEHLKITRKIKNASLGRTFYVNERHQILHARISGVPETQEKTDEYLGLYKRKCHPPHDKNDTQTIKLTPDPDSYLTQNRNNNPKPTHTNTPPESIKETVEVMDLDPSFEVRRTEAKILLKAYRDVGLGWPKKDARNRFITAYVFGDHKFEDLIGYIGLIGSCRLLKATTKGPRRLLTLKKHGLPMRDNVIKVIKRHLPLNGDIQGAVEQMIMHKHVQTWFDQPREGRDPDKFVLNGDFDEMVKVLEAEVRDLLC